MTDFSELRADLVAMIVDDITFGTPLDADTDLLMTELVDSLGVVRIVAWIEERLDTEIDPADVRIDHFRSVDAMISYLGNR
ncbi:MAG: phosphopantetheine-binding protein [Actinomycetota bacterium]